MLCRDHGISMEIIIKENNYREGNKKRILVNINWSDDSVTFVSCLIMHVNKINDFY